MKALPLVIVIEDSPEVIQNWSLEKRELIFDLGIEAASYMISDENLHEQVLVEFCSALEEEPYADVMLSRENLASSIEEAEEFYVQEELYEKAVIARNLLTQLYKN